MKIKLNILYLSFIIILILVAGIIFKIKLKEHKMLKSITAGHVVIDQELHKWKLCEKKDSVNIELFIRNKGNYQIVGNIVFKGSLDMKGLEERFIRDFIDCYSEETLRRGIKADMDKGDDDGRMMAVHNYIVRGKRLPQDKEYEVIPGKIEEDKYDFRFRQYISVKPGEVLRVKHEQQIPLNSQGGILAVKIETIEF